MTCPLPKACRDLTPTEEHQRNTPSPKRRTCKNFRTPFRQGFTRKFWGFARPRASMVRKGSTVRVRQRALGDVMTGGCRTEFQPQNSSITSSSMASEGRHSTRARAARSASGSSRPSSCARANVALSSARVKHSAQSIKVRDGAVTGMPWSVVTSSGWSGGPRWIATPGNEVASRGRARSRQLSRESGPVRPGKRGSPRLDHRRCASSMPGLASSREPSPPCRLRCAAPAGWPRSGFTAAAFRGSDAAPCGSSQPAPHARQRTCGAAERGRSGQRQLT